MPYICDRCSLFCNDLGMLNVHMRSHTNEKPFACPKCGREFAQKGNLGAHMRTHAEVKSFVCDQCSKQFAIRKTLDRHIVRCHPESASHIADLEKILKADSIRNARRRLKRLRLSALNCIDTSHITLPVINEVDLVFKCERCDRQFTNATKLQSHMVVHDGTKPYMCNICNKGFTQVGTLNSHIRFIHKGERPYGCPTCSKRFANKSHMKLHINTHIKQGALMCRTCSKSFSKMEHLMHHLCLQSEDKLFSCATCNKSFSSTAELSLHARIHVADGVNFKCNHCKQIFPSKESLLVHSTQYNSKKHICPICNSNYCDVRSLSRHMQSHLDSNSNACPICNRTYNRRNNLKAHIKLHISQINGDATINRPDISENLNGKTLMDKCESENIFELKAFEKEIVNKIFDNNLMSNEFELKDINLIDIESKNKFVVNSDVKNKSLESTIIINKEVGEQFNNFEAKKKKVPTATLR